MGIWLEYQDNESLAQDLFNKTLEGEWQKVVEMYKKHRISAISAKINTSGDTAFHIAVSIAAEDTVEELMLLIADIWESGLWITNNDGNTPLHVAVSTGKLRICILIADRAQFSGDARNKAGESPLFLAAFHGHKDIFLCLHMLLSSNSIYFNDKPFTETLPISSFYRRTDGETILHSAIRWEYFDLAFEIVHLDSRLAYSRNEKGFTPLHLLASKPSVFKSGCHRGWWKNIIYHCIYVEELEHKSDKTAHKYLIDSVIESIDDKITDKFPKNYQTCIQFYQVLQNMAQSAFGSKNMNCKGRKADEESASERDIIGQSQKGYQAQSEVQKHHFFRSLYAYCFNIFHLLYTIFIRIILLGLGYEGIKTIKRKHVHSAKIAEILIEIIKGKGDFRFITGTDPWQEIIKGQSSLTASDWITILDQQDEAEEVEKKSAKEKFPVAVNDKSNEGSAMAKTETTIILLAAINGITEMVEQILKKFPMAIQEKSEQRNIVLLAAENKQPQVLQLLLKQRFAKHNLIHEVDMKGNNALHLAANLEKQKAWQIPGGALQMQCEVKWYEFVKNMMPHHFCYQLNHEDKTPEDIFNKSHMDLVKDEGEWLKSISNSCSVVATLIAAVVFPASTTVPGGINDNSGMPVLVKHPAFSVFAISSLVALCASVISLFLFLNILTSQYQPKDFHSYVPRKLLLGLTLLFVSIGAMLISFCAGQFFLLKSKLQDKAFPVYTVICLPIILLSMGQLPLYFQLLLVTVKKVPPPSYKVVTL